MLPVGFNRLKLSDREFIPRLPPTDRQPIPQQMKQARCLCYQSVLTDLSHQTGNLPPSSPKQKKPDFK